MEKYSWSASRQAPEHGSTAISSPGPDSKISAAAFSAQLMQTPARSIPQPVQLQLATCEMSVRGSRSSLLRWRRRGAQSMRSETWSTRKSASVHGTAGCARQNSAAILARGGAPVQPTREPRPSPTWGGASRTPIVHVRSRTWGLLLSIYSHRQLLAKGGAIAASRGKPCVGFLCSLDHAREQFT